MIAGRKRHRHERMSGTFACARSRSGLVALSGQSGCPITALRPADKISSFPVLKIVSTVRGSPETNVCNATKLLVGSQLRVTSVALCNRRLPPNFRYAPLSTEVVGAAQYVVEGQQRN